MNQVRNTIKRDFTIVPNELINDNMISDRARFLFVYMLCKPEEWTFYNYQLTKALGYSVDTLRKYINELISTGWASKENQKRVNGKFTANVYVLYQKPIIILPCLKNTDTVKNPNRKNKAHSNIEYSNKENYKNFKLFKEKNKNSISKTKRGQPLK